MSFDPTNFHYQKYSVHNDNPLHLKAQENSNRFSISTELPILVVSCKKDTVTWAFASVFFTCR